MFYQENDFQHPLSHPGNNSVRAWLNSIGPDNRTLLRHLELTFLNTERAIESLDVHYRMRPAKQNIFVENVMWDDGQMGEMEWHVFTAQEEDNDAEAEEVIDEEDAKSIKTSVLFDAEETHDATNELEFEKDDRGEDDSGDDWETICSSAESTHILLAPSTPPQVHLTRKNGEAFGDPRWSFAGKFNDHVVRRLASCKYRMLTHTSIMTLTSYAVHREPPLKAPRKPVPVTLVPSLVVATDRAVEDGTESLGDRSLEIVNAGPVRPVNKRHSGVSWVLGC